MNNEEWYRDMSEMQSEVDSINIGKNNYVFRNITDQRGLTHEVELLEKNHSSFNDLDVDIILNAEEEIYNELRLEQIEDIEFENAPAILGISSTEGILR